MESQGHIEWGESITVSHLRKVAYSPGVRRLARLSSESLDHWLMAIARQAPSGHAAAQVLARLANENGGGRHALTLNQIQQDIQNLFAGLQDGSPGLPASILWAYRRLLRLAGINPLDAFPQGAWQLYAAYGMRDDPARLALETDGFDSLAARDGLVLTQVDRLAALLMAASDCLHSYPAMLENAWRERVLTRLLFEVNIMQPEQTSFETLHREWEVRTPPGVTPAGAALSGAQYALQRRAEFDRFLEEAAAVLPEAQRAEWQERLQAAEQRELPAYLRQMNILTYFEPGLHGEVRHNLPLSAAQVGVVVRGVYYLLPSVDENGDPLNDPRQARELAGGLFGPAAPGAGLSALTTLARVRRSALPGLRALFSHDTLASLDALRTAPLLINVASPGGTGSLARNQAAGHTSAPLGSQRAGSQTPGRRQLLGRIRLGERALGDHPLTVFDSGTALVFDAAASLFDPVWACSLAEIFTMLAARAAAQLSHTSDTGPGGQAGAPGSFKPRQVFVRFQATEAEVIQNAPLAEAEASAEVDSLQLRSALQLRALCKQRPGLPQFTVNDLLLLYRAIHAITYRPAADLVAEIKELQRTPNPNTRTGALIATATRHTLELLQSQTPDTPAVLVCFDVSPRSPVERQRPVKVQAPVHALNLVGLHHRALQALGAGQPAAVNGEAGVNGFYGSSGPAAGVPAAGMPAAGMPATGGLPEFDVARGEYLAALSAFTLAMQRLREAAHLGESPFQEDTPLPAHLAAAVAGLLRTLPGSYDLFAEMRDGEELFTNLGMAAPNSSLTRFLPARDDDPRRSMVWGVLTSSSGVMHITLRDFRPHVPHLHAAGLRDLADRIAQDYLNAFARGFNRFVYDLTQIIRS